MSYSFGARAASKSAIKVLLATKFAEVLANQPSHAGDMAQAEAAANAFVDVLPDDDTKDVSVSVNGSVGWRGTWGVDHVVTSANFGVSANLVTREAAPT